MADEKPKVKRKVRAEKYDEKVKFNGTLEQLINVAAHTKMPKEDKASK